MSPALAALLLAMPSAVTVARAQSDGATDWFGRGIVRVRDQGSLVQLDLRVAANGLLLRLAEHEPVQVLVMGSFAAGESAIRLEARAAERVRATTNPGGGSVDPASAARAAQTARAQCSGARSGGAALVGGRPNPDAGTPSVGNATRQAECLAAGAPAEASGPQTVTYLRAPPREYLLLVLTDQPLDSTDLVARLAVLPEVTPATAAHDVAEFLVGRASPMWAGYLVRR